MHPYSLSMNLTDVRPHIISTQELDDGGLMIVLPVMINRHLTKIFDHFSNNDILHKESFLSLCSAFYFIKSIDVPDICSMIFDQLNTDQSLDYENFLCCLHVLALQLFIDIPVANALQQTITVLINNADISSPPVSPIRAARVSMHDTIKTSSNASPSSERPSLAQGGFLLDREVPEYARGARLSCVNPELPIQPKPSTTNQAQSYLKQLYGVFGGGSVAVSEVWNVNNEDEWSEDVESERQGRISSASAYISKVEAIAANQSSFFFKNEKELNNNQMADDYENSESLKSRQVRIRSVAVNNDGSETRTKGDASQRIQQRRGTGFVKLNPNFNQDDEDDGENEDEENQNSLVTFDPKNNVSHNQKPSNAAIAKRRGTGFVKVLPQMFAQEESEDEEEENNYSDGKLVSFNQKSIQKNANNVAAPSNARTKRRPTAFVKLAMNEEDEEEDEENINSLVTFDPKFKKQLPSNNNNALAKRRGTTFVGNKAIPEEDEDEDVSGSNDDYGTSQYTDKKRTVEFDSNTEAQSSVGNIGRAAKRRGTAFVKPGKGFIEEEEDDSESENPDNDESNNNVVTFDANSKKNLITQKGNNSTFAKRRGTAFVKPGQTFLDDDGDEDDEENLNGDDTSNGLVTFDSSAVKKQQGNQVNPATAKRRGTAFVKPGQTFLDDDGDEDDEEHHKSHNSGSAVNSNISYNVDALAKQMVTELTNKILTMHDVSTGDFSKVEVGSNNPAVFGGAAEPHWVDSYACKDGCKPTTVEETKLDEGLFAEFSTWAKTGAMSMERWIEFCEFHSIITPQGEAPDDDALARDDADAIYKKCRRGGAIGLAYFEFRDALAMVAWRLRNENVDPARAYFRLVKNWILAGQ